MIIAPITTNNANDILPHGRNEQENSHLVAAFDDISTASNDVHTHHYQLDVSWKTMAALLLVVFAASIASAAAARDFSVTVALTEGFVAAVAVASVSAAGAKPAVGDCDPGTAWSPAFEEAAVLPAAALYLLV